MTADSDCYTNKLYKFRRGSEKLGGSVPVFVPPGKIFIGDPGHNALITQSTLRNQKNTET